MLNGGETSLQVPLIEVFGVTSGGVGLYIRETGIGNSSAQMTRIVSLNSCTVPADICHPVVSYLPVCMNYPNIFICSPADIEPFSQELSIDSGEKHGFCGTASF
jgi:hypothetical protein